MFTAFPAAFISTLAGLALLGTIGGSLANAAAEPQTREAALITYLASAANIKLFGIGGPFGVGHRTYRIRRLEWGCTPERTRGPVARCLCSKKMTGFNSIPDANSFIDYNSRDGRPNRYCSLNLHWISTLKTSSWVRVFFVLHLPSAVATGRPVAFLQKQPPGISLIGDKLSALVGTCMAFCRLSLVSKI